MNVRALVEVQGPAGHAQLWIQGSDWELLGTEDTEVRIIHKEGLPTEDPGDQEGEDDG